MSKLQVSTEYNVPDGFIRIGHSGEAVEGNLSIKDTIGRRRRVEASNGSWLSFQMMSDPTVGYSGNCCGMGEIQKFASGGLRMNPAEDKELIDKFVQSVREFDQWPGHTRKEAFGQYYLADLDSKGKTIPYLARNLPGLVVASPQTHNRWLQRQGIRAFMWIPPWSIADRQVIPTIHVFKDGKEIAIPVEL